MAAFRKNQQQFKSAVEGALGNNPLAELAKRNMEMFTQAAGALMPARPGDKVRDAEIAALKDEIAALKDEVATLKAQLKGK
jgi:polyhydroxyalkanoate synthesis regulator protein